MWPRTVEVMFACWLAISPFIFRHADQPAAWWWNDWITALLIGVLALLSFIHQIRWAHLLELPVAAWLIGYGWITSPGGLGAPAQQNWICVGLLLLMLAIIPTDCLKPTEAWQDWNKRHGIGGDRPENPYGRSAS